MSGSGNLLTLTPIWAIGLILFGGMIAFSWLGSWLRGKHDAAARDKGADKDKQGDKEGLVVSSVMGLLALLIGFTFSLALDRYDARRAAALEEANAIGTTYLRTQMLSAPYRGRISQLLVAYADNRLVLAEAAPGPVLNAALATNDRLITQLWQETVASFPTIIGYDFSSSYLETMNEMIDMDAARKAARRANIPSEVFLLLLVYQLVAAGVVGYMLVGERGRQSAVFLFLLFGLALLVVMDLNRPNRGWIRISQQPIIDLIAFMRANPPSVFGSPSSAG